MNLTKEINRKNKMDNELKAVEEVARIAKKSIEREYNEKECNHDVIIKIYTCEWNRCHGGGPSYICLGCGKELSRDKDNLEEKMIIDFSRKDDGTTIYQGDYNLFISYLQVMALELEKENPDFTDEAFAEKLRKEATYIKVPKDFNPLEYFKGNVDTNC